MPLNTRTPEAFSIVVARTAVGGVNMTDGAPLESLRNRCLYPRTCGSKRTDPL